MKYKNKFGFLFVFALIFISFNATSAIAAEDDLISNVQELKEEIIDSSETYVTAPEAEKATIKESIRQRIQNRKTNLLKLAKKSPQEFLNNTLTGKERSVIPSNLQEDIETAVTIEANIETYHIDRLKNQQTEYQYFLNVGKERLEFYPTDNELLVRSGTKLKVSGYKLGNILVARVNKSNLQVFS